MFYYSPLIVQAEGIPLQKDVLIDSPILAPEDLPDEITFTLYDSKDAAVPLGFQTFSRGQYSADFEFSKSDGISGGNIARVSANFTNNLNLKDAEGESIQPKEIWAALEVGSVQVGERSKVSDETLVQLLLASDASMATYLTLVYEGDDNPITTIYKDLPISALSSDGAGYSLKDYFSAVASGSADGIITPNSTSEPYWDRLNGYLYYNNGNVGIGTSEPNFKFVVANSRDINFQDRGISIADGSEQIGFWMDGNGLYFKHCSDATSDLYNCGNTLVSFSDSGKVGIGTGTTSPATSLQIAGANTPGRGQMSIGSTSGESRITFYQGSTFIGQFSANTSTGLTFSAESTYPIRFVPDGSAEKMRITSTGNVGIGTTNPGSFKLAVEGKIGCRELTVFTRSFADFVFEDTYALPHLNEVEQFILDNKHLPGIPTEAEVKEKGISIGEMNVKLLQKIEELTLYVININKDNAVLKAKLSKLESELKENRR